MQDHEQRMLLTPTNENLPIEKSVQFYKNNYYIFKHLCFKTMLPITIQSRKH